MGVLYKFKHLTVFAILLLVSLATFHYQGRLVDFTLDRLMPAAAIAGIRREYLVFTTGCVMPDYDPWSPKIRNYLQNPIKISCNAKKLIPLTTASLNNIRVSNVSTTLKKYALTRETIECYYQQINRRSQNVENYSKECDNKYSLGSKQPIDLVHGANISSEGVFVQCKNKKKTKVVYQNVHYFFPPEIVKNKINKIQVNSTLGDKLPLNLLMVGIDSTSRQNMRRYMPKTFNILTTDENTVDLTGYNKVADNTDPNIFTILTGEDVDLFLSHKLPCYTFHGKYLDDCSYIWKNFSNRGYATAYAEDSTKIGLFHYNKIGFLNSPTDYYHRPSLILADNKIGKYNFQQKTCIGLDLSSHVILSMALKAMDSLDGKVPLYGYFYTTSAVHNKNHGAAILDEPFVDFIKQFIKKGHNNKSIILFYSDHGMRFGDIRSSHQGHIEESMPFVIWMFPPWFKKRYPQTWENLQKNKHRLVTNYDLHLTLQDILEESFNKSMNPVSRSGYGQSLFKEVSENRTCKSIGVPEHYCSCQNSHEVNVTSEDVKTASNVAVLYLNNLLIDYPMCSHLTKSKVIRAQSTGIEWKTNKKIKVKMSSESWQTFMVIFETQPGGARFESTVHQEGKDWLPSDQFSRINFYGNQSSCVGDPTIKKVCYCI